MNRLFGNPRIRKHDSLLSASGGQWNEAAAGAKTSSLDSPQILPGLAAAHGVKSADDGAEAREDINSSGGFIGSLSDTRIECFESSAAHSFASGFSFVMMPFINPA
jgi:hypothetical protein